MGAHTRTLITRALRCYRELLRSRAAVVSARPTEHPQREIALQLYATAFERFG